jgi:hypothetical protein
MTAIRELLRNFPPILGEAGQPGYLVVALARQQSIVATLQDLGPSQREALARDWQTGRTVLLAQRQSLRQELRHVRKRGRFGHAVGVLLTGVRDRPGFLLLLIALAALSLVYKDWRWLWAWGAVAALTALFLLWWRAAPRPARVPPPPSPPVVRRRARPAAKARRQPNSSGA